MRIPGRRAPVPAWGQLVVMVTAGAGPALAVTVLLSPLFGALVGWDVAAASYLVLLWRTIWRLDADETARLAVQEDPDRALRDLLLLVACLASLVAVGVVLTSARTARTGIPREVYGALGLASVLLSWAVVHSVFTTRYARVYYTGPDGGVDFNQSEPPRFSDFAYLAFTIGATFQVSDTALTCNEMRTTVLRHLLLSYLFGAILIAATVNLLAGFVR